MSFQIATLPAPASGTLGICPLPGRWGDALDDFEAIRSWAPDIVVSMTETAEMARHNVADMQALLARDGIEWAHFPIVDYGTPATSADWQMLSNRLHAILDRNGRVLAHCYGGHGRSGMVLLRLMFERGMAGKAALDRLRQARPGSVETHAQEEWAIGH